MTFTLFRPGELRVAPLEAPLFLVEPIIPAGGIVMLHGPKTAGKTQLALTLAHAITTSGTFLNEYRCQTGSVAFVEADMPLPLLQERVRLAPEIDDIWFLHAEPFNVLALGGALPDAFLALQQAQPALVIVDSLRKTFLGDENDSGTPSRVYGAWRRLFPTACLAFMHHDRKKPTDPEAHHHPEEAARGTSAWLDDADTGLHLDKVRGSRGGGHVATLSFSKCRTAEEPAPMIVRMHEDSLLLEPVAATPRQKCLAWLSEHPHASRKEAKDAMLALGYSRATVFRALEGWQSTPVSGSLTGGETEAESQIP